MHGDTIFLDTILPATGIQSRIYLKTTETSTNEQQQKVLIPLDNNHKPIDTLTKFIIPQNSGLAFVKYHIFEVHNNHFYVVE